VKSGCFTDRRNQMQQKKGGGENPFLEEEKRKGEKKVGIDQRREGEAGLRVGNS